MRSSEELTLRVEEPGAYTLSTWRNILIGSWRSPGTAERVGQIGDVTERLLQMYPAGVSGIHVVRHGTGAPTPEGRAAIAQLMNLLGPRLGCVVIVLEGHGFWASTIRSVFVGLHMLSPRAYAFRVYAENQEVVDWLPAEHERRTGVRVDAHELAAQLRHTLAP